MQNNTMNKKAPPLSKICDAAILSAKAAGKVLMHHFDKKLKISEKPGAGLVTNADFEAQNAAVKLLRKKFPDFGFLTEETMEKGTPQGQKGSQKGRWIIDPLDGTTNYVHRFPMFCVSIAAEWEGEIVVGVIYHPVLKDLYVAVRGKGAKLNGRRIQVSKTTDLGNSLLTTGFTYRKDNSGTESQKEFLHSEMTAFEKLSGMTRAIRRPGSAALDLAYTARGVFDGFWERKLSAWDVAAGGLLVQEAGGQVSDFRGGPFRIDAGEILASNGPLHQSLLKEISIK